MWESLDVMLSWMEHLFGGKCNIQVPEQNEVLHWFIASMLRVWGSAYLRLTVEMGHSDHDQQTLIVRMLGLVDQLLGILPHKVQIYSMCISDYMQTTFFYLGRVVKKLADDQCSSITKGSIHIKQLSIQPFTMGVDWPEIGYLMDIYYVWYLHILHFYFVWQHCASFAWHTINHLSVIF